MAEGGYTVSAYVRTSSGEVSPNVPESAVQLDSFSLLSALCFIKPHLGHFGFTPTHATNTMSMLSTPLEPDREMLKEIIRLERKSDSHGAISMLLDWLLTQEESQPDALQIFLHALRKDTDKHLHVHNILCVTSVYLQIHQHLINGIAQGLQDGTLKIGVLLHLLQTMGLLELERERRIQDMTESSENKEHFVNVATFLLTCLYSQQAKILSEMPGVSRDNGTTHGDGQRSSGPNFDHRSSGPPAQDGQESCQLTYHGTTNTGLSGISQLIAERFGGRPDDRSLAVHPSPSQGVQSRGLDRLPAVNSESSETTDGNANTTDVHAKGQSADGRADQNMRMMLLEGKELWTEVLRQILQAASSAPATVWGHSLDRQFVKALWDTASELIKSGVGQDRNQAESAAADDAGSATNSSDSAETVRACLPELPPKPLDYLNCNRDKQEFAKVKDYLKNNNFANIGADEPDDQSVASVETNSRQRDRRVVSGQSTLTGMLREEEARQLKEGPIQLRPYQDELLESARQGNNVLIWLPTGTGKTYNVLKYAEEHLKGAPDRRVAFIVPKVRLARQQYERFLAYLPEFKPHLKCGETSGSASSRQPLGDILKSSSVVVLTGQCLVEAVEQNKVTMDQFTLLVLDECHHTRGGHPLRVLMNQYMELKYQPQNAANVKLPQIIGLTASPGVGRARGKEVEAAVTYLNQLCARLDVSHICSVKRSTSDLRKYVNVPSNDIRECGKRKVDKLKERIESLMKEIEDRMFENCEVEKYVTQTHHPPGHHKHPDHLMNQLQPPASQRGQDQYTQWLSNSEKAIKEVDSQKAFYAFTAHIDMLRHCQKCLILNEDCDSLGALELLKEEIGASHREKPNAASVDEELFRLFERYTSYVSNEGMPSLQEECARRECQNPKLKHLEELLLNATGNTDAAIQNTATSGQQHQQLVDMGEEEEADAVEEGDEASEVASSADTVEWSDSVSVTSSEFHHLDDNVRGMVFVRTLDLSKALLRWMNRHRKLNWLKPGRITGVNASVKDGGMTKSEVTEVMAKFNAGEHKVVICTSAAEEGLDFKACNLVIRFLYEASMVSMIQTRGRAREENSRYCVMGRESTDSMAKEKDNLKSELTMCEAVENIQQALDKDPDAHYHLIQQIQRNAWSNRWSKDIQEKHRLQQRLPEGMYRLRCRRCKVPACTSEEIRLMRMTNRVVIGAEFSNKYERRDTPDSSESRCYDRNIPRTGMLHCRSCGLYWGIIVRSVVDGIEFPVIPIKSFLIEDSSGSTAIIDQWGKAFNVPEMTEEDRQRHTDPMLGPSDHLEGDVEQEVEQEGEQEIEQEGGVSHPPNDLSRLQTPEGETEADQEATELKQASSSPSYMQDTSDRLEETAADQQETEPKLISGSSGRLQDTSERPEETASGD